MPIRKKMGWGHRTWVLSRLSDFSYDFRTTLDREVAPPEYNFKPVRDTRTRERRTG